MSAFYKAIFHGIAGGGAAAVYVGKGVIVGIDANGGSYQGTYQEEGDMLIGQATLTSAGGMLVTGAAAAPGTKVPIKFTLRSDLGGGQPVGLEVGGKLITVSFEKIGDIP